MKNLLYNIQKDYLKAFLNISTVMPRIFDKNVLQYLKDNYKNIEDQEEQKDLIIEEDSIESLFNSSSENEKKLIEKIYRKTKEKKINVEHFKGKTAEHLFSNRVDKDVFDLKYHNKFKFNIDFNFFNINQEIPIENSKFKNQKKYIKEIQKISNFFSSLNMKLEGEDDFIIENVAKKDIHNILSDNNKKYFAFGDKNLFTEETYEILGEVTINLFHPLNYINKLKQLLKYIIITKLYENNADYFKDIKSSIIKKAIMVVLIVIMLSL